MLSRRFILLVEELEARVTPSNTINYRWDPINGNDWSFTWIGLTALGSIGPRSNWLRENGLTGIWFRTRQPPGLAGDSGTTDNVEFTGADGNKDCIVEQAVTLHAMIVDPNYGSAIKLEQPLTISGSDIDSVLRMSTAGSIEGFANAAGAITRGSLTLDGRARFTWKGGLSRILR